LVCSDRPAPILHRNHNWRLRFYDPAGGYDRTILRIMAMVSCSASDRPSSNWRVLCSPHELSTKTKAACQFFDALPMRSRFIGLWLCLIASWCSDSDSNSDSDSSLSRSTGCKDSGLRTEERESAECPAAGPQQRTKDRDEPISISIPLPSSCAKITQNVSKLEQLSWAALRGAPSGGGWRTTVDCSCLGLPWSSVLRGYRTYRLLSFYLEPTGTTIRTLQEELLKGFP